MPVNTMATARRSAAAITSLSLTEPPGLDDRGCASRCYGFKAVRKREEGIRCGDAARERQDGLHRAKFCCVDPAHLSCTDANCLAVACVDDCIRLDMLADTPCEEQCGQLVAGGLRAVTVFNSAAVTWPRWRLALVIHLRFA